MPPLQPSTRPTPTLRRLSSLLFVGFAALAGCLDDGGFELDSAEQAATTAQIFATQSIAKGASKSGTYTAPETGTLTFKTAGTGDADLYVKRGTGASRTSYTCKSDGSTSTEQCVLTVTAGESLSYYVYAYAAASVNLTATSEPSAPPPPPNTTTTTLVPNGSIAAGTRRTGIFVAPAAGELVFRATGTGDVDLYVKRGSTVTTTSSDCKSEGPTSVETCRLTVTAGQQVAWLLNGYAASVASLTVTAPNATTQPPSQPITTTLIPSGSIARGASKTGSYTVTTAGSHVFKTAGTGDVDLYVRKGSAPTTTTADCKSETSTAVETCTITAAVGDRLYYLVYGYTASTASLTLTSPAPANPTAQLSQPTLSTTDIYTAFSNPGGTLSTSGRSLKFLIDNRTPSARTTHFINGNYLVSGSVPSYAKYHYDFAKRTYNITDSAGVFNNYTYFSQVHRFYAGNIQTYFLGEATTPTYAVQFYPDDVISEAALLEALTVLKPLITIPGAKLAFVATGPQQTFATIGTQAAALGFDLLTIDQVLGNIKYVALNTGEAWGYLRIFPTDSSLLKATDIPVFDELPLDLTVVAGVMTRAYQDINSHINLKSKERGTPNMVLRDASATNARLAPWNNQPIHLMVNNEGFTIEATTDAIVQQKLADRLNKPWIPLPIVDESRLLSFDEVCPTLTTACLQWSDRLGGKATGMSFLTTPSAVGRVTDAGSISARFGYNVSPQGFAIPVKYYRDFVNAPENALLKSKIDAFVALEKAGNLAPAERNTLVLEIQNLFYKGRMPGTMLADITNRVLTLMPGIPKFKFRSSATSEDIENFNGAGLYDSFSAELEKVDKPDFACELNPEYTDGVLTNLKMKPKTIQCAVKGVYASLWNTRAVDERTFARLDHATAGMGIAVNPSYDIEDTVTANAVLVTRVVGSDVYGYSLSVQDENNLVTNPSPGTVSEFTVAAFSDYNRPPRFTTTRFAVPVAGQPTLTSTVLTEQQMIDIVDIAKSVEIAFCNGKASYFPGGTCSSVWLDTSKPRALDMELKILANGQYVLKQVREFHGR